MKSSLKNLTPVLLLCIAALFTSFDEIEAQSTSDPMIMRLSAYPFNTMQSEIFENPITYRSLSLSFGHQYKGFIMEYELEYTPPMKLFAGPILDYRSAFSFGIGYCFNNRHRLQFPILIQVGGSKSTFKEYTIQSAANYYASIKPAIRLYFSNKQALEISMQASQNSFGKIDNINLDQRIKGTTVSYALGFVSFIN